MSAPLAPFPVIKKCATHSVGGTQLDIGGYTQRGYTHLGIGGYTRGGYPTGYGWQFFFPIQLGIGGYPRWLSNTDTKYANPED